VGIVAATAVGAATAAIGAGRFDLGADGETALVGAVIDEVDDDASHRPELFDQVGVHEDLDVLTAEGAEGVVGLVQSQSQYGTASAIAHEIDVQRLAFGLVHLEDLADFLAGGI
jgi:hypothetical protein